MWLEIKRTTNGNCSINVDLIHRMPVIFQNLKNYGSYQIVQEGGEFGFGIKFKLFGLEQYGYINFMLGKHFSLLTECNL